MAKAAASLDVLSGGRFELGLGAGGLPDVIASLGGPRRTPGESVEALEEAIDVIRLMWSSERSVSFDGKHYRLDGARPGPRPAHPIGIWLGAFKPRMIRLVGRKADGWLPSLGVLTRDELRAGNERIDAAAEKAGRDPRSIRRILNLQGVIGEEPPPPPVRASGWVPGRRTTRRDRPTGGSRRSPDSPRTASTRSCSGQFAPRVIRSSCWQAKSYRVSPGPHHPRS